MVGFRSKNKWKHLYCRCRFWRISLFLNIEEIHSKPKNRDVYHCMRKECLIYKYLHWFILSFNKQLFEDNSLMINKLLYFILVTRKLLNVQSHNKKIIEYIIPILYNLIPRLLGYKNVVALICQCTKKSDIRRIICALNPWLSTWCDSQSMNWKATVVQN